MMHKASSLGSLLNQHTSDDGVGNTQSALDRQDGSTGAQVSGADRVDSDGGTSDSGSQDLVSSGFSSRWQREDEQKHDVQLDMTLEAEEELRRMCGLR